MGNLLFLLTSAYPLDNGETFVENEISYLEKAFDKIIIICSSKSKEPLNRYVPKNAEIIYYDDSLSFLAKLSSIKYVFSNLFWNEIVNIRNTLKLRIYADILKTLLIEILKAKRLASFLKNKIYLFEKKHDIFLYSYWIDYRALTLSFVKSRTKHKLKCFSRAHGWDVYFERHHSNYLPLKNYIYKALDAIFPISIDGEEYIKRHFKKHNSENGAKIILSKLGTNKYFNDAITNINNNELVVVSCSQIYPNKQVDLIAKTLINYKSNLFIKWYHFGTFLPNFSEQHYNELINIINNNNNSKLHIILMGNIPNSDLMKFYNRNPIDIFINLSLSEGIPVSIIEAMSFGIPVIATAVGGTPEIVKDNYNGFLLSANTSSQEVAGKITYFYNLPDEEKKRLRNNAYKTWNEEYNANKNYKNFVENILTL